MPILCQPGCQLSQKCIYSVLYHKRTKFAVSKLSKPKVRLNVFLAQISRLQPGVKLTCELRARSASLTFGYQIRAGVQLSEKTDPLYRISYSENIPHATRQRQKIDKLKNHHHHRRELTPTRWICFRFQPLDDFRRRICRING